MVQFNSYGARSVRSAEIPTNTRNDTYPLIFNKTILSDGRHTKMNYKDVPNNKESALISRSQMVKMILYNLCGSPPARAVQMMFKALNIDYEEIEVNIDDANYMNEEFIKINPQRSIPTLDDNGNVIWDSHAIMLYLIKKFGKEDEYYSSEPLKRAIIDQRLHFDSCNVFGLLRLIARPIVYHQYKGVSDYNIYECNDTYERLNLFLEKTKWVVGDDITVADFSLIPSVTSLDSFVPIDGTKYPNILKWIDRAKEWPFYNVNQKGVHDFVKLVNRFMDKPEARST